MSMLMRRVAKSVERDVDRMFHAIKYLSWAQIGGANQVKHEYLLIIKTPREISLRGVS